MGDFVSMLPETLITFLAGFLLALIADWLIKEPALHALHRWGRRLGQRRRDKKRIVSGFMFGRISSNFILIQGNGDKAIDQGSITCRFDPAHVAFSPSIERDAQEIGVEQARLKGSGLPAAWDGDTVHIESFVAGGRSGNDERYELTLNLQLAHYFEFMATASRLDAGFRSAGCNNAARNTLLDDFKDWRSTVPPNIVNGLPVNLFVITDDDKIVFARRAHDAAIAPDAIACTINENMHSSQDVDPTTGDLSVARLVARALYEEIGWKDSEHAGTHEDPKARSFILSFGVHTVTAAYGFLGYVRMPISFTDLEALWERGAKDHSEIVELIPKDFSLREVSEYIRKERLYHGVGVCAMLALIHGRRTKSTDVMNAFP